MDPAALDDALSYTREGEGTALLTLHGGMGWDHTYLRPWLDPLGHVAEVIYFDQRGHGLSPVPEDWTCVSHATWVEDANALRASLGLEDIVLFGHSYGGFLALEYALRFGSDLRGLILCCTAPVIDFGERIVEAAHTRANGAYAAPALTLLTASVQDDEHMRRATADVLPLYFHRNLPGRVEALVDSMRLSSAAFTHAARACLPSFDVLSRLVEIKVPTLILSGRHDWLMQPEYAGNRLHAGLPGSEHVVFETSGHFPFIEENESFIRIVSNWLRQLPQRDRSSFQP